MKSRSAAGFTLVELMMVVAILGVLSSMIAPRVQLVLERAYEGRSRGQLGAIRSAIQLYYTDTEGTMPFHGEPDGVASDRGRSMSAVLTPTYITKIPTPYLADHFEFPPGLRYDSESKVNMATLPIVQDIVFVAGPPGAVLVNRPFVYDPTNGHIYFCNGNYAVNGDFYYNW